MACRFCNAVRKLFGIAPLGDTPARRYMSALTYMDVEKDQYIDGPSPLSSFRWTQGNFLVVKDDITGITIAVYGPDGNLVPIPHTHKRL